MFKKHQTKMTVTNTTSKMNAYIGFLDKIYRNIRPLKDGLNQVIVLIPERKSSIFSLRYVDFG